MPAYESPLVFASPVPTQRPWLGSTASAPTESVGASSVRGVHVLPENFQTPPSFKPRSDDFPVEVLEPASTGVTANTRPSAASSQKRPARERQCGFFTICPPIP